MFLFRLALALGAAHPDDLLDHLDSHQIAEWLAFAQLEPFGERMADYRAGQLCATVANYAGKTRAAGADMAVPGDFMPALAALKPRPAPVLLDDREAHSRLIKAAIFRKEE